MKKVLSKRFKTLKKAFYNLPYNKLKRPKKQKKSIQHEKIWAKRVKNLGLLILYTPDICMFIYKYITDQPLH